MKSDPEFRRQLLISLRRLEQTPALLQSLEPRILIRMYRELRDVKSEYAREAAAKVAPVKDTMEAIEAFLLDRLNQDQVNSVNTDDGAAIKKTNTYVKVKDWGVFLAWAQEHGHLRMLKRDVTKTEITAFMDEFEETPPGIDVVQEVVIQIRKP